MEGNDNFPVLSAQGVFAFDLDSSVVLYEKNPDQKLLPASTTKMITALVSLDEYNLDQVVSAGHVRVEGQKMGLEWNEKMKVRDLLYGLLIHSGNDAAEVLAMDVPGGRDAFVAQMNAKAKELHADNTHFENPSGLDAPTQRTTAHDLAKIASYALKNPVFANYVSTIKYTAKSADGKITHYLTNRNELLGKVDGVLGVKTGWTEAARENLVTYIDRDNHRVVIALLGSQDRFGESKDLIEWIYKNYQWEDVKINSALLGQGGRL